MPLTEFVVYLSINLPDDDFVEVETRRNISGKLFWHQHRAFLLLIIQPPTAQY